MNQRAGLNLQQQTVKSTSHKSSCRSSRCLCCSLSVSVVTPPASPPARRTRGAEVIHWRQPEQLELFLVPFRLACVATGVRSRGVQHVMFKVLHKNVFSASLGLESATLKCLFVSRSEESAVQTDGRQPAQRQVETRTTAPRVLRHLTVMTGSKSTKLQTASDCFTVSKTKRRQHPAGAPSL